MSLFTYSILKETIVHLLVNSLKNVLTIIRILFCCNISINGIIVELLSILVYCSILRTSKLLLLIRYSFHVWARLVFIETVVQRCPVRKCVLRSFAKFTGKHLCQSLRPATLLKKRLWHKCFPVNFATFLRTYFLTEHLRWLLLSFSVSSYTCITTFLKNYKINEKCNLALLFPIQARN